MPILSALLRHFHLMTKESYLKQSVRPAIRYLQNTLDFIGWLSLSHSISFKATMSDKTPPERGPLGVSITAISDTHGCDNEVEDLSPPADLLIHAGDFTKFGKEEDLHGVKEYLDRQRSRFQAIVIVNGNHECNAEWSDVAKITLEAGNEDCDAANIHFLKDELVEVTVYKLGQRSPTRVRIWGTQFYWPMRRARPDPPSWESALASVIPAWRSARCFDPNPNYDSIPKRDSETPIDILVTHGPVRGRVDGNMGCGDLAWRVENEIKPRAVVCGHIHHAHGMVEEGGITYVNAAICGKKGYKASQAAVRFEI